MWFFALIVIVLIGAVAVVASGRWGAMGEAYVDRPDVLVPARHALTADDIESSRFAVGLRGYRMDEVDSLLERVAREVAERDRRIADLERAVTPIVRGPDGAGFTPRDHYASNGQPAGSEGEGSQGDDERLAAEADGPVPVGGERPQTDSPMESAEIGEPAEAAKVTDPGKSPEDRESAGPGEAGEGAEETGEYGVTVGHGRRSGAGDPPEGRPAR
jgi:DivIVA domain-containing protein